MGVPCGSVDTLPQCGAGEFCEELVGCVGNCTPLPAACAETPSCACLQDAGVVLGALGGCTDYDAGLTVLSSANKGGPGGGQVGCADPSLCSANNDGWVCDGGCTSLETATNCGACGAACPPSQVCSGGGCYDPCGLPDGGPFEGCDTGLYCAAGCNATGICVALPSACAAIPTCGCFLDAGFAFNGLSYCDDETGGPLVVVCHGVD